MPTPRSFEGFTTKIPRNTRSYGGGHFVDLSNATNENIRKHLGTSLSTERKEKYSRSIWVMHQDTGFVYRVYMSFGEWRIGTVVTDVYRRPENNGTYREIAMKLKEILDK